MATLQDALIRLYGGDADAFVSTRRSLVAQARAAGERALATEIAALRKPTVAASTVNRLPQDALDEVLALGNQLRAAQTRLDAATMKELTSRRQQLLHDVVAAAGVSGATAEDVRATLLAATADAEAARAVATRALVKPLRYSGWGDVDVTDAVAHQNAADAGRAALRLVADQAEGVSGSEGRGESSDVPGTTVGQAADDAGRLGTRAVVVPPAENDPARRHDADDPGEAAPHLRQRRLEQATARRQDAERMVQRLTTRLRAAQAALDAASAARDGAQAALKEAQRRLDETRAAEGAAAQA